MPSTLNPIAICNQALSWLGANRITSFADDSNEAHHCDANYIPLRDALLEDHEWSFAIRRKRLSTPLADPNDDYKPYSAFKIPDDDGVIRVLQCATDNEFRSSDMTDWVLEDNVILVHGATTAHVRYVYRVEDSAKFSPAFTQAFVARLAVDLCLPITESNRLLDSLNAMYESKLAAAVATDGLQGRSRRIRSTWMLRSRHQTSVPGA